MHRDRRLEYFCHLFGWIHIIQAMLGSYIGWSVLWGETPLGSLPTTNTCVACEVLYVIWCRLYKFIIFMKDDSYIIQAKVGWHVGPVGSPGRDASRVPSRSMTTPIIRTRPHVSTNWPPKVSIIITGWFFRWDKFLKSGSNAHFYCKYSTTERLRGASEVFDCLVHKLYCAHRGLPCGASLRRDVSGVAPTRTVSRRGRVVPTTDIQDSLLSIET